MTTVFLPRSAWTNHGPVKPMKAMATAPLRGYAIHWPGSGDLRIDAKNQRSIAARLEGYRAYHVSNAPGHGWSDIAYQVAIDQAGRVWDCRGIKWQSAANGNQAVNASHGAVLLLYGLHESPSPAMVQAELDWRRRFWLPRYPRATQVVGHRDLQGTDCPGASAYALVKNGSFARPPAPPPKPTGPPRHIAHLMRLRKLGKLTRDQALELAAWEAGKPWPPIKPPTPTPTRKPLVTDYVFGVDRDIPAATAVAATVKDILQVFQAADAKLAADGGNHIIVLGGPAATALGLSAPVGATTTIGNYVVANGNNGPETVTRGLAAAQALRAG